MTTLLPHLSAVHISGSDAQTFLQAQLSSNVLELTSGHAQLSSWCALNGRVLALGWLYQVDADFYWIVANAYAGAIVSGLTKFKLRSKVNLAIDTRQVISGASGAAVLSLPDGRKLCLADAINEVQDSELAAWNLADIKQQMAIFGGGERFLPQMLNLEKFQGLSLKKGCFPGQEIIARTFYKGEVKRELRVLQSQANLQPGSYLVQGSQDRVEVLQAQAELALAVLNKAQPATLSLLPEQANPASQAIQVQQVQG